jgi:hypothetical protein
MDIIVALNVRGQDYITDLQKRLKTAGVSYHALAREMTRLSTRKRRLKIYDAPQISRWMHKRVRPNLTSIELIEESVANLSKKK